MHISNSANSLCYYGMVTASVCECVCIHEKSLLTFFRPHFRDLLQPHFPCLAITWLMDRSLPLPVDRRTPAHTDTHTPTHRHTHTHTHTRPYGIHIRDRSINMSECRHTNSRTYIHI